MTIPCLELCGAYLLTQLLHHIKNIYQIPVPNVYAWTDSTNVLNWLNGSPRCFKFSLEIKFQPLSIVYLLTLWNHVSSINNPADCASQGLYLSDLLNYELWWKGPNWLTTSQSQWPKQLSLSPIKIHDKEKEVCLATTHRLVATIMPFDCYSTFSRLQ